MKYLLMNISPYVILIVNSCFSSTSFSLNIISLYDNLDAVIEQQTPMTGASLFWLDTLHQCNLDQSLPLPCDRYRLSNQHRTGRGTSISFDFGQDISHHFLLYASLNNIRSQHLALAIYYVFLFKLTNEENDLCIGMNTNGRYRDELKSLIGMFVNAIPLRCRLNPHWSFDQLVRYVCEIVTSSMKYSYFPLQRILAQHPNVSKPAFLDTSFGFQSTESRNRKNNGLLDVCVESHPDDISTEEIASKFDFLLTIQHDLSINQLSYTINVSFDLFDTTTVHIVTQRFHSLLEQIFVCTSMKMKKPIQELSLILPDEKALMESLNNTEVSFPSAICIPHEFVGQVINHPQKVAVELDDQSLTYCELLHYVQVLSLYVVKNYGIVSGEIICQCVERSISMVSRL
jgi:non-ribosomal peptide synthetase component F